MLSLVWVDGTTGVPLIVGTLSVAVTLILSSLVSAEGFGPGWGDPMNMVLTMTTFSAPLALGAAVTHTAHIRRLQLTDLAATTPKGWLGPAVIGALASLGWALAGQVVAIIAMGVRIRPVADENPAMLLLVALAVTLVAAASLVGSAVGVRWSAPAVAPVLAITLFAAVYGFGYARPPWRSLSPVYPGVYYSTPVYEPNVALVLGQLIVLLGMAGLATACLASQRVRRLATLGPALVVTLVGGLTIASAPPGEIALVRPDHVVCKSSDRTRLCVYPQYAAGIRQDLAALDELRGVMDPFFPTPRAFRQEGLTEPAGAAEYLGMYATDQADRRERALAALLPPTVCPTSNTSSSASIELGRWALSRAGYPDPYAESPDYASWTDTMTRRWVTERLAGLSAPC